MALQQINAAGANVVSVFAQEDPANTEPDSAPVSYTHLTLPTSDLV